MAEASSSQAPSLASSFAQTISQPFRSCLGQRSSSSSAADPTDPWTRHLFNRPAPTARDAEQSRRLLNRDRDEYDDADAISLLSDIAVRESTASRRRAKAHRRAARENAGDGLAQLMACGLFGRVKGQIQRREVTRGNLAQQGRRHQRTASDVSTDSAGSLVGGGRVESGDEDAGMLDDQAIADLSISATSSRIGRNVQDEADEQTDQAELLERQKKEQKQAAKAKAQAERKRQLEQEAVKHKKEAEEEEARQKKEEAKLAAEEEAAIAMARRKAERRAAKAGLLKLKEDAKSSQGWRTEAEAEAAAGGFDSAEEQNENAQEEVGQQQYFDDDHQGQDWSQHPQGAPQYQQGYEAEYNLHQQEPYAYDQGQDPSAYEGEHVIEEQQGGVIHHHYYYHAPPQPVSLGINPDFLFPNSHQVIRPSIEDAQDQEKEQEEAEAASQSEDEADIAGLTFAKKKNKRDQRGSGSGRKARSVPAESSSQTSGGSGSASAYQSYGNAPYGAPSSAASSKPSYRDRPRRHKRRNSRSSNSSSGYNADGTLKGTWPSACANGQGCYVAPTLPNLHEQGATVAIKGQSALYAQDTVFGRNQKRSYRDKTSPSLLNTPRNPGLQGVERL